MLYTLLETLLSLSSFNNHNQLDDKIIKNVIHFTCLCFISSFYVFKLLIFLIMCP